MIHQVSGMERCWSICTLTILFSSGESISFYFLFFSCARYLTFDDPNKISLDKCKIPAHLYILPWVTGRYWWNTLVWLDVFNTECHPFKAAPASEDSNYGTGSTITSNPPFSPIQGNLPSVSAIAGVPDLVFGPKGIISTALGLITGWLPGRPYFCCCMCEETNLSWYILILIPWKPMRV